MTPFLVLFTALRFLRRKNLESVFVFSHKNQRNSKKNPTQAQFPKRRKKSTTMVKLSLSALALAALMASPTDAFNVLVVGSTRFKGAYLWKELYDRGHTVTVFNKGKQKPFPVPGETDEEFATRLEATTFLKGDRKNDKDLKELVDPSKYEYVYDMVSGGQDVTEPLAEMFVGQSQLKQYIYNSKAGVYKNSIEMPHLERNDVDKKGGHKGRIKSENCLDDLGLPWCSIRQTYVCGPQNHRDIERYFFERIDQGRPICIPGHGEHLAGFGHVKDLAVAFVNIIGREDRTSGNVYNVQNSQAMTLDGVAMTAAQVMGKDVEIIHYDPEEFEDGKKDFPLQAQHEFTGIYKAMKDLDWEPKFDTVESIFQDSYDNEFVQAKADGKLKNDFGPDDDIIAKNK